jgi:hypothetical protein
VREELVRELISDAGLTEEQARRAIEVFEAFLKERDLIEGKEEFRGLFASSVEFFEDRD